MPLRSQRPAKAYLFPQLGPVEGEQMEPTPTPAPGWPAGAQGPGITLPAARTPPWVTPTPTTGATTIGATAPSPTSESPATPFGPPGTPFAPPVDPSAPEIVDYPPNGSIRYRYLVDKMQETDANGKPTGKWVLDWYHYKLLGQLLPEGWPETKVNPQTGEIMGWDIKAADYTMSTGRYASVPAPGAPPEAVLKYRSNPDGGIVQYWQPWKLVNGAWVEDVATGEDNYRGALQGKTASERQVVLDQQKRVADADTKAYRDEQTRIANENLKISQDRLRLEAERQKPKTYPLPPGYKESYPDAEGNIWRWSETENGYVKGGYEEPAWSKAKREADVQAGFEAAKQKGLQALWNQQNRVAEQSWAESRNWAIDEQARQKAAAEEAEKAFTRGQVQPFSAILGAIMQRTGQPVGAPIDYEDFMRAIIGGRVPSQIPQPAGTPTPPWNLLGERVDTLNALRGAGAVIPGASLSWYDLPGIGRVHAGSPEFGKWLTPETKVSMEPLPQGVAQQYGSNVYPSEAPFSYETAPNSFTSASQIRQGQAMAATNPYAAMFAEQDRAKAEEKQREIQGLAQQLGSRRRFWQ